MRKPVAVREDILTKLNFIRHKKQEYFVCFSLDSSGRIITRRIVTIGLLDSTLVHPREVFAGPLKDRAKTIIVAHNHPSGDPTPSKEDIKTTQQLVAPGLLLGVRLEDHVIVARLKHFSFKCSRLI